METKIINTTVNIIDEESKFENDKDIKAIVKYNSETKEVGVTVPATPKRDHSPNLSIFESKSISLRVRVLKDGRMSPSGRITEKVVRERGEACIKEEFARAAEAICNHVNNA